MLGFASAIALFLPDRPALAADSGKPDRASQLSDEDFTDSPSSGYGEFNEEADELAETKFFQYGRFFGVSLGGGIEGALGNRGTLWQGGFPTLEIKIHYWFDFQLAMALSLYSATQFYETQNKVPSRPGHADVNMTRIGLDLRYYFDVHDLSAPISFANPYLLGGVGSFSKNEYYNGNGVNNSDSAFGVSLGVGLEFAVSPRKTYFQLEARTHFVNFQDTYTSLFSALGLNDLTGPFYTITGAFMFTW